MSIKKLKKLVIFFNILIVFSYILIIGGVILIALGHTYNFNILWSLTLFIPALLTILIIENFVSNYKKCNGL